MALVGAGLRWPVGKDGSPRTSIDGLARLVDIYRVRKSDMEAQLESPSEEVTRLRGRLNDLVRIMSLPANDAAGEPTQIISALLDELSEMLCLDFVFVRLNYRETVPATEMMRVSARLERIAQARDIGEAIDSSAGGGPLNFSPGARLVIADVQVSVTSAPIGLNGEIGTVVVGSQRLEFPEQTERLLLDVAANLAAMRLRQARVTREQTRVANQLVERVAQRTSELAAAHEQLKLEVAQRKHTEATLRESEDNSRRIVDSIPGLVALLAADGDVEVVSRQILDYSGKSLEEFRQWRKTDVIHPDDLARVIRVFTQSIASGSAFEIVQRLRRSDGAYRWFENSGFPVRDANGRIIRWCVLLTDVDERNRAEDALKRSERSLKLMIDTIPALAWTARPDGSAEFFNQHYLDFVGLSAEQARDSGWTAAVHPDDLSELAATWQRIMASEAPGEAEARLRRYDGAYRWFLFRANPLRDEQGNIVNWYGINTDIEDRKQAEAELRQAYDHLTQAQRLSHTGSFTSDLLRDKHTWSDEFYRICEFEPGSEITIQRLGEIVHPEDGPLYQDAIQRAIAGADPEFYFRIVTSGGVLKHLRGFAHRVAEQPVFIGAVQDVTESRLAEDALHRASSELAHVARVATLSVLTASVAHEVNQPLSGIITNASTCLRMLDADPPNLAGARETARRTIRDGNRASDVIERLRALFSKKELALDCVDLNEATREVIAVSLSDLRRNRVVVQSEFADELPSVTGDRVQLQQVIMNLLRNASDAMLDVDDRPRLLLIRTEQEDGNRVRVTVRDAGVGVDPQSIDRLFDAFYTTKSGGMGIGLSVSRSIIERHHGHLWVEPNDGPGATFAFTIPLRHESSV